MLAAALGCADEGPPAVEDQARAEVGTPVDVHDEARARLLAFESAERGAVDFAELPASDGRFGADPYRVIALPDGRFAGLLRGADQLVLLDADGAVTHSATAPHDPSDLVWRAGELLVVGTGEARVARYGADALEPRADVALPDALAPRAIASGDVFVWVADEGLGQIHELRERDHRLALRATQPYCRGPIALHVEGELLLGNCLLEHRVRIDRVSASGELAAVVEGPRHDGPIWSFELGPADEQGARLLALTGVEDHPLERRDGGFGYIDSFVFIYELRFGPAPSLERRASVNVSERGVVTPKWSRWLRDDAGPSLIVGGYATAELLTLRWSEGLDAPPEELARRPALPGISDAVVLDDGGLLAADPLLDRWLRVNSDSVTHTPAVGPDHPADDRAFEERLGEALVFTTAMAPWNEAAGKRSRFTCETCHFEGRGDGRVHFTGRERDGQPVHATSKPLLGLFPNRPHFSRALDRRMAQMVDNEFGVANRHNGRDPWFALDATTLPWLRELEGWPEHGVDGETLRRALMRFLMRWSMPSNPATRGRSEFTELEATGAELFATHCEDCHQARLVADDPGTRVARGPDPGLEPWRRLIFSANAPLVWGSSAYVQTGIVPWVHAEGARVPALRRLYLKWPYFTNGGADSLDAVLEGVRLGEAGSDHELGPAPAGERGLSAEQRRALLAFLRLL